MNRAQQTSLVGDLKRTFGGQAKIDTGSEHKTRRPPSSQKRSAPLSIRLSDDERARLEVAAGGQPLGVYVRGRLFGDQVTRRHKARHKHAPVADRKALAQMMGVLGQSGMADNLALIAEAVRLGTLIVDDDLRNKLNRACADIVAMRLELMKALGLREGSEP